jgi:hypothetical protein
MRHAVATRDLPIMATFSFAQRKGLDQWEMKLAICIWDVGCKVLTVVTHHMGCSTIYDLLFQSNRRITWHCIRDNGVWWLCNVRGTLSDTSTTILVFLCSAWTSYTKCSLSHSGHGPAGSRAWTCEHRPLTECRSSSIQSCIFSTALVYI